MSEKINIELDTSFIDKFFELTDAVAPSLNEVNLVSLKKQLYDVGALLKKLQDENNNLKALSPSKRAKYLAKEEKEKEKKQEQEKQTSSSNDFFENAQMNLNDFASDTSNVQKASEMSQLGIPMNYNQPVLQFIDPENIQRERKQYYDDNGHPVKGKVLVIDDLGVITYQLGIILKRAGYLPVTAKEIYDAVDKYKRGSFDYIIMDLFIPTAREGFILIEELKKIAKSRNEQPVIAVMSASTKKEYKQTCQKLGTAFFVEKVDDWQKELFGMLIQYN